MTLTANNLPTVAIVVCTHNGAQWIEEQIESLFQQDHPIAVRVFDDASSDDTVARVKACSNGRNLQYTQNPVALGVVKNFAAGIQSVLDEGFDYIALADQDDIWTTDRVASGMKVLLTAEKAGMKHSADLSNSVDSSNSPDSSGSVVLSGSAKGSSSSEDLSDSAKGPSSSIVLSGSAKVSSSSEDLSDSAKGSSSSEDLSDSANSKPPKDSQIAPAAQLVHSDLCMVNAHNQEVHRSFMQWRRYRMDGDNTLRLVLGQNGVMGNTILMNRALANAALPFPKDLHVHDYWLAVVAELVGQRHYIDKALVRYRIHDKNVSNSTSSVSFGTHRWFKDWSIKRFLNRDFYLPYKEDSRFNAVNSLLNDERFQSVSAEQRSTIETFIRYLKFDTSRLSIARSMICGGFFRPGLAHKLRVTANIMTTRRYR